MIDSKNCVVAFLDILGYEYWLSNHTPEQAREIIHRHFETIARGSAFPSSPHATFFKSMAIQSLSDSLIILLPESENLYHAFPGAGGKEESKATCILTFLGVVAWIVFHMVTDSKLLLRGAITYGQYYQNQLNEPQNQFIFSKALHEAYILERQAGMPRVIVDDSLNRIYNLDKTTFRDNDGQYCLDIYNTLIPTNVEYRERHLKQLVGSLKIQWENLNKMEGNKRIEIQKKLYWFTNYHNTCIEALFNNKQITNKNEFKISLPDYLS